MTKTRWFYHILSGLLGLVMTTSVQAASPVQTITVGDKRFRALAVAPETVHLHWKDGHGVPYGNMVRLKKDLTASGKTVVALMNAGIYSSDDTPAGLFIENGKPLKKLNTNSGRGNFHLQPNGVFVIDRVNDNANDKGNDKGSRAQILTTAAYQKAYGKTQQATIRLATQSGPMLLIDGKINPKFIPDSASAYSRNGVCTTPTGELYFFATDVFPTVVANFYTTALAAQALGCDNALYLDGNISKLYVSGDNSTFHFSHFVGILSVELP